MLVKKKYGLLSVIVILVLTVCFRVEPDLCPLCSVSSDESIYLIDLYTGMAGKLPGLSAVDYDPDNSTFQFVSVAGCSGYRTTAPDYCEITISKSSHQMNPFRFCHSCRNLLRNYAKDRYVLLSFDATTESRLLYAADTVSQYRIGNYSIIITPDENYYILSVKP